MNPLVFESLLPILLLIATGFIVGRAGWIRAAGIGDLSNLIFLLLAPALLFRTMSKVRLEQLDFKPVAAYFAGAVILFGGILIAKGFTRFGAVLALTCTYSNTVMIGIPLVGLIYGPQALVTLLTLVSMHSLILLTTATIVLELAVAREQKHPATTGLGAAPWHPVATVLTALKNAIINPVPLPIIAGLVFSQSGLVIPGVIDRPLALLANAFSPLALVMVGVTLASTPLVLHWRLALLFAAVKNLIHPLLVVLLCYVMGVTGLPRTVMIVAAALPIGDNVFLFAQRYQVAQELTTATVVVSTIMAMFSLTVVLILL